MRASSNASKPHSYGESFSGSGRFGASSFPRTMGATPTPMPTRINSRTGKYSASIDLVPTSRLELLRLFRPPAPQAGVSTNFTTWAKLKLSPKKLLRNVLVLRALGGRGRGFLTPRVRRCGRARRYGRRIFLVRRLLALHAIDHAARVARLIGRDIGEREAQHEEHGGE